MNEGTIILNNLKYYLHLLSSLFGIFSNTLYRYLLKINSLINNPSRTIQAHSLKLKSHYLPYPSKRYQSPKIFYYVIIIIVFEMKLLILISTLLIFLKSQTCIGHHGSSVDWWVVYNAPNKTYGNEAGLKQLYFDSKMLADEVQVRAKLGDASNQAIHRTLSQTLGATPLNVIAWNDQPPNGSSSSSSKAHSKFYMVANANYSLGFAVVHSIPRYPTFNGTKLFPTIADSQKKNAQHSFCMTISNRTTFEKIFNNTCSINPVIYIHSGFPWTCPPRTNASSQHYDFNIGATNIRAFYKNGHTHSKDDLFKIIGINFNNSSVVAQTWGIGQSDCTSIPFIKNSNEISVRGIPEWSQTSDHSKWLYTQKPTQNHVCFGDLNRNTEAQQVRGGAFYCVLNKLRFHKAFSELCKYSASC